MERKTRECCVPRHSLPSPAVPSGHCRQTDSSTPFWSRKLRFTQVTPLTKSHSWKTERMNIYNDFEFIYMNKINQPESFNENIMKIRSVLHLFIFTLSVVDPSTVVIANFLYCCIITYYSGIFSVEWVTIGQTPANLSTLGKRCLITKTIHVIHPDNATSYKHKMSYFDFHKNQTTTVKVRNA